MLQLRRITSGGRFVPEIDGLRFVAIASVVLYHLHGFVAADSLAPKTHDSARVWVEHGYRGVNLFYVISGFILSIPFASSSLFHRPVPSLRAYFWRRLTRLEPPYILNLLICFGWLHMTSAERPTELIPHLAASLGYLHSFIFAAQSPINPVAWTLEVEVQFYCLAPLLTSVFRIRSKAMRRTILLGAIVLAGVLQATYWEAPARLKLSLVFAIQFFLAGFLLTDIYLLDWHERPTRHWSWDLISIVCWLSIFLVEDRAGWTFLPLLLIAACYGAFAGALFNRFFRVNVVTILGGMCYSIYLFHYVLIRPVLDWARSFGSEGSFDAYFAVQALLYLPVLLLVSGLFFVAVERPCMVRDWPRRMSRRFNVRS